MNKGISLHIGINSLSTKSYRSAGILNSPGNDANAMAALAMSEGYSDTKVLVNEKATRASFFDCFSKCIETLDPGDTFLFSYSGHGGQTDDTDGDEADGKDETWCFYDGRIIDDEIGKLWKEFKPGVRIIVVSSSCHSRTAIKPYGEESIIKNRTRQSVPPKPVLCFYPEDKNISASILHISACEDKRQARDGDHFSSFTGLLLKNWDNGRFTGSYEDLVRKINLESGYLQQSGIALLGNNCTELLHSPPFKLLTYKT